MREILARSWLLASTHLERLDAVLNEWENPTTQHPERTEELSPQLRHNIAKSYAEIIKAAEVIGAPVTKKAAERARRRLLARKEPITFKGLHSMNAETKSRLEDETGSIRFYCLEPTSAGMYNPDEPLFGSEVDVRIPKSASDIGEAGKCFAVGRYTAAVFHLMRAMEAAVQKISEHLGIENLEREWGKLLSDVHKGIEPMPRGSDRDNWSQVHANLYHVKQAWRNDTMHPKATYTEEEAREVFDAMRAFMRHLASMLPPSVEELIG